MKYELVIFDLDGTLVDTIEDLGTAVNYALSLRKLPEHTMEEYRGMVGHGVRNLVEVALPEQQRDSATVDSCLADFLTYYKAHIDVNTRPYVGMQDLLSRLSAEGAKLAVASNKFQEGTETIVGKFFGNIPFVAICGNREGFPLKPDPELVEHIVACAFPGETASGRSVVLVGDSDTDMKTAANASIPAVAVTWGFRSVDELKAAGASVFAGSAAELATRLGL